MDDQSPIFRSLAMIEERIREKLTVENLAQSLHFSRYHYQRLFQETVGESVMRYVNRRRVYLAALEIAGSKLSILEIALRYGYDSHEGFTRSFKAHMGVTPAEYRKYHVSIKFPWTEKERCAMLYSKNTNEIIRELNNLIVQAKETAEFTAKMREREQEAAVFYGQFLELLSLRAQELAERLSGMLERVTDIARCPDQISARFMIIKAIEDTAFWSNIIAFQVRLTVARAKPEHRKALASVNDKYAGLAENARIKAGKIAGFFNELSALIFQDMRENTEEKIQNAVKKGEAVGKGFLADPALPYSYIGEEILAIARELSSFPLEKITVSFLEDCLLRMDIIIFAGDMDVLRMPSHQPLFEGIKDFREGIADVLHLFQDLAEDIFGESKVQEGLILERTKEKLFKDLAFQGNILLFYLKGEVQKLGTLLDESQKAAFGEICGKLGEAVSLAHQAEGEVDGEKIMDLLGTVWKEAAEKAGELGEHGLPVGMIAEEIGRMEEAVKSNGNTMLDRGRV